MPTIAEADLVRWLDLIERGRGRDDEAVLFTLQLEMTAMLRSGDESRR